MARLFKINTLNSDGTEADHLLEFRVTDEKGKLYLDDEGQPAIVVMLKPISQGKYRQVVHEHTERIPARKGQPPREETDWDKVQDALVAFAVQSWKGIVGADDKPLQCVLDAKLGLPGDLKNELVSRAMQGEAVDPAASFRPAS